MSGAGEGRWRRSGNQQQQQQQPQSSSRERANAPNRQSMSGNAWTNQDKAKGAAGAANAQQKSGQQSGQPSTASSTPAGPLAEQHVPVKEYNAGEAKQFLKKSYQNAVTAAGDEKKLLWKPQDGAGPPKPAWGTRADRMAGNRDFWALLRNQINQLEQGKAA